MSITPEQIEFCAYLAREMQEDTTSHLTARTKNLRKRVFQAIKACDTLDAVALVVDAALTPTAFLETYTIVCPTCEGEGVTVDQENDLCPTCDGNLRIAHQDTLDEVVDSPSRPVPPVDRTPPPRDPVDSGRGGDGGRP